MRPGILALTITSLASTVPISCMSPVGRTVTKYQISDPMVSNPRIMKTLLRAFILPPVQETILRNFGHRCVNQNLFGQAPTVLAVYKESLAKKTNQGKTALRDN